MRPVNDVVVLIARVVPVVADDAVVWAGASPVPYGQGSGVAYIVPKVGLLVRRKKLTN